jgi:hypothetical protein
MFSLLYVCGMLGMILYMGWLIHLLYNKTLADFAMFCFALWCVVALSSLSWLCFIVLA